MILYVDGDSYSTPNFCVDADHSYWKLFANRIGALSVTNHAYTGKSNEGMFRNATRFCLENTKDKVFVLIGLSHLERFDLVDYSVQSTIVNKNPVPAEHGVLSESFKDDASRSSQFNREFEECVFLSKLINFYGFLKTRKNVSFMIHFCSKPLVQSNIPMLESLYHEVTNYPEVVNLFKDTYQTVNQDQGIKPVDFKSYGWAGHHGVEGNQVYVNYLVKKYQELYEN